MGIDIDKTISRTFIIGGALGGAAGFLFGTAFGFSNTMGFIPGVKAFAAAVLGGIGNIRGAMLGGLLLGFVEALVPTAVPVDRHRVDRRRRVRRAGPGPGRSGRPASSASVWGGRHEPRRLLSRSGCVKRLARLPGRVGFVLALMVGPQEGTQEDYGYAFRQAIFESADLRVPGHRRAGLPRDHLLAAGQAIPAPARRPAAGVGALTVVAAYTLLHWDDPLGDGKFGARRHGGRPHTGGLSPLASAFFGWLHWTLSCSSPARRRWRRHRRARPAAGLDRAPRCASSPASSATSPTSRSSSHGGGIDHSLGAVVAVLGYLIDGRRPCAAAAADAASRSPTPAAVHRPRAWAGAPACRWRSSGSSSALLALTYRRLVLAAVARTPTSATSHTLFTGIRARADRHAVPRWLGWVLLAVGAVVAVRRGCYLRHRRSRLGRRGARRRRRRADAGHDVRRSARSARQRRRRRDRAVAEPRHRRLDGLRGVLPCSAGAGVIAADRERAGGDRAADRRCRSPTDALGRVSSCAGPRPGPR